ncbi:Uncharacterised protein [Mycobacteroides abscessus]|nr:Uncharacterised protein [Mycobacteroides abscessus]
MCRREYRTAPASGVSASPTVGHSIATPMTNAAADAEWPDGNEGDVGGSATRRHRGRPSSDGRTPPNTVLPTTFARTLDTSSEP